MKKEDVKPKILFAVDKEFFDLIDKCSDEQFMTRSEFIRNAIRTHMNQLGQMKG